MVVTEGLTVRPCSRRMYQSTPIPASSATSSRLRPAVRRRLPLASPSAPGFNFDRRERRKSPNSILRASVMVFTHPKRKEGSIDPRIIPGLSVAAAEKDNGRVSKRRVLPMKAAVLKRFGSKLAIETMPDPALGTGEVIVD